MKKGIFIKSICILSVIIITFSFISFIILDKFYGKEEENTILNINDKINVHNSLLNDNKLSINYNLNRTNENTYLLDYILEYNNKKIENTLVKLEYALSEKDKNKILNLLRNNNIYLIKGQDDIDYFIYITKDFYKENIHVINNEGVLLSKLIVDLNTNIGDIIGYEDGSYIIKEDNLMYLKNEVCDNSSIKNINEYSLTIKDNEVKIDKTNEYETNDTVVCNNIEEFIY